MIASWFGIYLGCILNKSTKTLFMLCSICNFEWIVCFCPPSVSGAFINPTVSFGRSDMLAKVAFCFGKVNGDPPSSYFFVLSSFFFFSKFVLFVFCIVGTNKCNYLVNLGLFVNTHFFFCTHCMFLAPSNTVHISMWSETASGYCTWFSHIFLTSKQQLIWMFWIQQVVFLTSGS